MSKRKVLLTGASGYIASLLLPVFRERYDLTLVDVRRIGRNGNEVEGVQIADMANVDRESYRSLFAGQDAIVHCGFLRAEDASDPDQRFTSEFGNVQMAYNVYQTAYEVGVPRVVVASSNHAADYYEPLILDHKMDIVTPETRAFSDNYYGWAKETYEHLGFIFAVGKLSDASAYNKNTLSAADSADDIEDTRQMGVVQIRIGGPRETDIERCTLGDMVRVRRALGAYISQRDLCQLFVKSVETDDIRDENGIPFQVFYGISGNSHAFWSITNARRVIGYEPQDNSEIRFRKKLAEHLEAAASAKESASG